MNVTFGGYFPGKEELHGFMESIAEKTGLSVICGNDGKNGVFCGRDITVSCSEDKTCIFLFRGYVWNVSQIRQKLKSDGFATNDTEDDTSVLRDILTRCGVSAIKDWNGHFCFVFWNKNTQTLLLGRDRFGVQPLYYYHDSYVKSDGFAFATDMSLLRQLPLFQPDDIRLDAVLDFLAVQYIPGEKTLYNRIFKLLPGHVLTYSLQNGKKQIEPYVTLPQYGVNRHISYADACAELRCLTECSVKARLAGCSDVKGFLSGGLDSAILTGLTMNLTDMSLFSASILDEKCREYDEKNDALATYECLCKKMGKHPSFQVVDVKSDCLNSISPLDEPYADASLLPFSALCRAAGFGTVLTGEGGDELFFGYDRYRAMRLFRYAQFFPCRLLAKLCPSGGERSKSGRWKRFFQTAAESRENRYFSIVSHNVKSELTALLGEDMKNVVSSFFTAGGDYGCEDAAEAAARFDMQYYLPGDCFPKCRFGSAGTDCVFPMPFLDNAVADFAIALPLEYKLQGRRGKRILYDAFADILPADMPFRKKRGFGVPIGKWLCCDRKPLLYDAIVKNSPSCFDKWFDKNRISALIDEHVSGMADHTYLLYSLFSLSLYLKKTPLSQEKNENE